MQNRQNDALPDRKDASRHTKRKANKNQKRDSGLDQTHPVLRSQIWVELREKIDNEQSQDVRKMKREYRPEGFAAHPSYGPQPSHIPLRTEAHQRRKGSCAEKETKIVNFPARTQGLHEPSLPDKQMLRALPQRFPERKSQKNEKIKRKENKKAPSSLFPPFSYICICQPFGHHGGVLSVPHHHAVWRPPAFSRSSSPAIARPKSP